MQQRLPSLSDGPICFAHRGARAHVRENTLEAFRLALRLGANGIETDAWVTRDGRVVLDHDGVVRRRARKVPISRLVLEELPDHIPTLEAVLGGLEGTFDLSIDVKDPAASPLIEEIRRAHDFDSSRLWLCFHRLEDALTARRCFAGVRIVDSTRLARISEGVERRTALLAEHKVDVLNMHISDWSGGLVTLVHRFGVRAFGWDLQHEHLLHAGMRMGLDGVYSDFVDRMVEVHRQEIGYSPRR